MLKLYSTKIEVLILILLKKMFLSLAISDIYKKRDKKLLNVLHRS